MSTRWYPLYQRGNPQLRIFLPNFWLKLVKPESNQPPNVVVFHCSMEMTRIDVQNYLEKIYNVKTVEVRTRIEMGKTRMHDYLKCVVKDDDVKVAYAILPKDQVFKFPYLHDKEKREKSEKEDKDSLEEMKTIHKKFLKANNKPGVPGWFSI
ncbi:probable 39S ribosomal protein L23, mitochondrial [Venturia canescens]|uniref:probable 39S ribosomal protein L23, mitochondrial n=1 Tax=Venturia canescens TaxID=32260 RepID=UPI001C9C16D8|nr:probable 39S ribosomal protein L23, mitochondrial [Venturia canescens]